MLRNIASSIPLKCCVCAYGMHVRDLRAIASCALIRILLLLHTHDLIRFMVEIARTLAPSFIMLAKPTLGTGRAILQEVVR